MKRHISQTCLYTLLLLASQAAADAADIQFRSEAVVARGIVRLGDVAEVTTSDATEARLLEGIALVPAPSPDVPKLLKRQEVQQLLQLSGVSLREHRFSGSEVTQIRIGTATVAQKPIQEVVAIQIVPVSPKKSKATEVAATAEGRVGQAIVAHLQGVSEIPAEWQAEVAMSPRVVQALADQPIVRVEGGVSPWLGRQQFMLLVGNEAAPIRLPVEAEVSGTARAVTVIRTIERGNSIAESDLQLQTVSLQRGVAIMIDPQQVVGRETARTLNAGQLVTSDMIRTVRLVKRGEEIQVFSIAAGLQISEPGKALTDGSDGDTIQVEFVDRRKMSVRVTGLRRGEVYAMQTSRSQVQAASATSPLNRR
ncbi:flagellar basal body P-ring formation chaperone FlgA [Anatilimnocola floriformis]|uniref:flagellar basal body P-ring formation chaperone FlgA n=1 Tax=Anatilimnocola floriformis TaxID=2948575 RepID=UPI0020C1DBD6|nr:flagellar basal body P-ring formation chaperone FlgA [Anatilimnocola floriformis]